MHIERKSLSTHLWYRLTKVFFFVAIAICIAISVALMFAEFNFGLGVLLFVSVVSEIVRQLFFYVVTGDFLTDKYKRNAKRLLKPFLGIVVAVLVVTAGAKGIGMISASMCSSKLGSFASYENGTCGCIYGYTLQDKMCVSNEEICEKTLGKYSIYDDGSCRCLANYSQIDGTCVFTSDICAKQFGNSHAVTGDDKCYCDAGYIWNENRDHCIKFVPPPLSEKEKCEKQGFKAKFNVMNNTCECTFDYVKINGVCQEAPYCGERAHYEEGKKCVCDSGYKREGSNCIDPGCSTNSIYDAEDDKCYCKDGYIVRNGVCKSAIELCGLFGKYNPNTGDCVQCQYGYELKGRDCVLSY